jgi:hypothetical protein
MESQTPVIPGLKEFEIIVGGPPHQPEYSPLHILVGTKPEVRYYARFKLTDFGACSHCQWCRHFTWTINLW